MVASNTQQRPETLETRDDIDLEHRLVNFLHARHVQGAETVHFEIHKGTVVVSGTLPSGRAKWLFMGCCRNVAGVIKLIDEVVVETH